ncbi:MAG: cadherin domain-containing protein, partial [Chitinophagaceae bacterium]
NSIYQTESFLATYACVFNGVYVAEAATSNTVIRNNFIGGSAPECGGGPYTVGGQGVKFNGVVFWAGSSTGTNNTVENNTIRNIDITSDVLSNSAVPFTGIQIGVTRVNVINNAIGSTGGNDDIKITTHGSSGFVCYGINFSSASGGSITGNKAGGITIDGDVTANNSQFYGIYANPAAANFEVSNNVIGSETVANSIRAVSATQALSFNGIVGIVPDNGSATYKDNTIAGVAWGYSGTTITTNLTGIRVSGYYSHAIIDHNTISDMSSASLAPAVVPTATFQGIWTNNKRSVVSNNIVRRLRLTGTAPMNGTATNTSIVTGIHVNSWDTSAVKNNRIYELSSANDLGAASVTTLNGVIVSGAYTIYNNLISLDNHSLANNCEITGIKTTQFTGSIKVFHNTVYIGGSNGASSHTAPSSALSRKGSSSTYGAIKNNLFVNTRTGGNGDHFIYYNDPNVASVYPVLGWLPAAAANNMVVTATIGKIAQWDANSRDSTQWKADGGDANSSFYTAAQLAPSDLFADLAGLKIRDDAWRFVKGKGAAGTGIATDYAGRTRSTIAPTNGAYEYPAAALTGLVVSEGALSPVFDQLVTAYTDSVDESVTGITVSPSALDPAATIKVNGIAVISGHSSDLIALAPGPNTITVVITGPDAISETYTITVVRGLEINTAPALTSYDGAEVVTLRMPENTTLAATVAATDTDAGDVLVYSLAGGDDAGKFFIDPVSGELSFTTAPDFEQPGDADGDNAYIVIVQVSDGDTSVTQRFKIKITDANDHAPVITSYGGEFSVTLRMEENTTAAVGTVAATDVDKNTAITYSLVDEEDAGRFFVSASAGELKFITPPDFDQPGDVDGDNVYIVTVKASDGDSSATQRFKIKITNVNDNAPAFGSYGGEAIVNLQVPENEQLVTIVAAADADSSPVTYSILNDNDGAIFSVSSTGQLSFLTPPDFDHPADGNGDNTYTVSVKASDGSLSAVQQFVITVTDLNDNPPVVTMTVKIPENTVEVTTLEGADDDAGSSPVLFTMVDKEDGALFRINPVNGTLEFRIAPAFANPVDTDQDNTYLVSVKMTAGDIITILRFQVKVTGAGTGTNRSTGRSATQPELQPTVVLQTGAAPAAMPGKRIQAYPNPITGRRFTLRLDDVVAGRYTLELYSGTGQLVCKQQLGHTGKSALYPVQLPGSLAPGTYVLKLTGTDLRYTEKLIVE